MKDAGPPEVDQIAQVLTDKVEQASVDVFEGSVGGVDGDHPGDALEQQTQIALALRERLFDAPAVLDVGVGSVPARVVPRVVARRRRTEQEPSIGAVATPQPGLEYPRLAGGGNRAPPLDDHLELVGMERAGPARAVGFVRGHARIVEPGPVEEFRRPVHVGPPRQRRDRVDHGAELVCRVRAGWSGGAVRAPGVQGLSPGFEERGHPAVDLGLVQPVLPTRIAARGVTADQSQEQLELRVGVHGRFEIGLERPTNSGPCSASASKEVLTPFRKLSTTAQAHRAQAPMGAVWSSSTSDPKRPSTAPAYGVGVLWYGTPRSAARSMMLELCSQRLQVGEDRLRLRQQRRARGRGNVLARS